MSLSPRQREIMKLVCAGYTTKAIAGHMDLSPSTIKGYLRIVFARMKVQSRSHAAAKFATMKK